MRNIHFQNQLCGSRGEGWQRLHSFEKVVFLGVVGFSIGFTTSLLFFVGFSLEITTSAQKPTFRDEEGGRQRLHSF